MHILLEIALDILKHALRDVQALHVHHDLPDRLVFVRFLVIFIVLSTSLLGLLLFLLRRAVLTIEMRRRRMEGFFCAVGLLIVVAHDCVVNFSDGFEYDAAELALTLCIFAAD